MKRVSLIRTFFFALSFSLGLGTAHAETTSKVIGGKSANNLYKALAGLTPEKKPKKSATKKSKKKSKKKKKKSSKKSGKKKKSLPTLTYESVECVYTGPGADDACHECLAHQDKQGKPCKLCEELVSAEPDHCKVNSKDETYTAKQMKRLGDALRNIPSQVEATSGGWFLWKIENVTCKKDPAPFCRYSFTAP